MDLKAYLKLLRAQRTLILLCAFLGLAAAAGATLLATPIYESRTTLFISTDDGGTNVDSAYQGNLFTQQRVKSYSDVITSPLVLEQVVKDLGLPQSPQALAGAISVDTPLDTVLINIRVRDELPNQAQAIADAAGRRFVQVVQDLEAKGESVSLVTASIVTPATLSSTPVSPRPRLNLPLGLLVGLAVGVAGALAREVLDTSIKTAEELRERYDLPALAVIPYDTLALKQPLIVDGRPGDPRVEAFRQLRTSLQFVDVDRTPRSILVTSSGPGEGKTSTASNLAVSLAAAGRSVIVVDADLRRPRVAEYFGLVGVVGLTDVLSGQVTLEDALQPWGADPRVQVLPAGSTPPNPSEILGSQQMTDLLGRLEGTALTILDAPPLLPVADAAVLAPRVSGVIVMVSSGDTRREHLEETVTRLRDVGAHLYGTVLNRGRAQRGDAYAYGYYGYGPKDSARKHSRKAKRAERAPDQAPAPSPPVPAPVYTPQPVSRVAGFGDGEERAGSG